MIFNIDEYFQESYKERNLYAKLFAGCLFNELIPNNQLPYLFLQKIQEKYKWTCSDLGVEEKAEVSDFINSLSNDMEKGKLHLMFDYHIKQVTAKSDGGELADIFISGSKGFIAIEAKSEEPWEHKKDIISNRDRINKAISKLLGNNLKRYAIQVLLVRRSIFDHYKRAVKRNRYTILKEYIRSNNNIEFVILFWEDLLELINKQESMSNVSHYLSNMLNIIPSRSVYSVCEYAKKVWFSISAGDVLEHYEERKKGDYLGIKCKYNNEWCKLANDNIEGCQIKIKLEE